jgi:aspartate/glutamate racemase
MMVHADMAGMVRWAETGDARSMARYVADLIARLKAAGATFAAMPGGHAAPLYFRTTVDLPFAFGEPAGGRQSFGSVRRFSPHGAVGTRFTVESAMFGALTGVEVVQPRPHELDHIHKTYFQLASTGAGGDSEREGLTNLAETDDPDAYLRAAEAYVATMFRRQETRAAADLR